MRRADAKPFAIILALVATVVTLIAWVASFGASNGPVAGAAAVTFALLLDGTRPALWMLGALGFGLQIIRRGAPSRVPLALASGVGAMLSLDHALGALGLLDPFTASGLTGLGLLAFLPDLLRWRRLEHHPTHIAWSRPLILRLVFAVALLVPGASILIVASCNPPGWIWDSEAFGYDVLSYHLQLPIEWRDAIRPLEHNVYSALPSYMEAAFLHLFHWTGFTDPTFPDRAFVHPSPLLGAQILHTLHALGAAWLLGEIASRLAPRRPHVARIIASGVTLATPWVLVTGSMAYNEMTMILLGAGALLAALDTDAPAWRTGTIVAFLTGCACGAKPTAIFMIAPPVGIMLLAVHPTKRWPALLGVGAAAGLVTLSPWLVRNQVHLGNPVFPQLTNVFGAAHWTDEQVARYAAAHRFEGPLADRLALLILPERIPQGPFNQRGVFHEQWFGFFPLAVIALAVTGVWTPCRRVTLALASGFGVQILAWLLFTHIQSRFLLPLVLTGSPMIGLLGARLLPTDRTALHLRALFTLLVAMLVTMNGWALMHYDNQHGVNPNALLVPGVQARTGVYVQRSLARGERPEDPWMLAQVRDPSSVVRLLGDATPLYMPGPVEYRTTWDAHDPDLAGVDMLLINMGEIARFESDGWNDPALTVASVEALVQSLVEEQGWRVVATSRTHILLERRR